MSIQVTQETYYYFCNDCNKMLTNTENHYRMPVEQFIKETKLVSDKVTSLLPFVDVQECQDKVKCDTCKVAWWNDTSE